REALLQRLSAQCGEQMQAYEDCVVSNPNSWSKDCAKLEENLSNCTDKSDGAVFQVRTACEKSLAAYRECVEKNNSEPDVCEMEVTAFVDCANNFLFEKEKDAAAE
ncbi:hypothetical protein SARC_11919, partial [Sphaeroforma arctica JP610]